MFRLISLEVEPVRLWVNCLWRTPGFPDSCLSSCVSLRPGEEQVGEFRSLILVLESVTLEMLLHPSGD